MRHLFRPLMTAFALTLCLESVRADENKELAALIARAAELEQQITALQQELNQVRDKIDELSPRRALTPYEAIEAAKRHPDRPVTVEYGVERISAISYLKVRGDMSEPPIIATWDNFFPGGGTLQAILPDYVYCQLRIPTPDGKTIKVEQGRERQQVLNHIEKHGIRVTGIIEPRHGFSEQDYVIRIDDAANVELYLRPSD